MMSLENPGAAISRTNSAPRRASASLRRRSDGRLSVNSAAADTGLSPSESSEFSRHLARPDARGKAAAHGKPSHRSTASLRQRAADHSEGHGRTELSRPGSRKDEHEHE